MAFRRLLIVFLFFYMINSILFSQSTNEITQRNDFIYIDEDKIIELGENERVYAKEYEKYIVILLKPDVHNPVNTAVYNKYTKQFFSLNSSLGDEMYYWNEFMVYRQNSKIGKWIILNIRTGTESLLEYWVEKLYVINNELCVFSSDTYFSITTNNVYDKDVYTIEIYSIDFEEITGKIYTEVEVSEN